MKMTLKLGNLLEAKTNTKKGKNKKKHPYVTEGSSAFTTPTPLNGLAWLPSSTIVV